MDNTKIYTISIQETFEKNNIIKSTEDEYNNNMIDIKTKNETSNNLKDIIIEFRSNHSNSVLEDENINEQNEYKEYRQELEDMLFSSDIEWGIYSQFDEFVMEHIEDEYFMKAINEIYIKNYQDENVLIKILNAISQIEYEKLFPFGQMVAISAVSNKSIAVQQKGIEAFEKWRQEDSIPILENLDVREKWLKKYVEKIIVDLKKEERYA